MKQKGVYTSLRKLLSNRMIILFLFLCFCSGTVTGVPLTNPYQTGLPDLVIEHVTWSPQFPQDLVDYKNTKFKITIRNRGQAPASDFSVTVAVGSMHVAMMSIEYLSPQRCVVVESSSFLTRSPGKYAVRVFVDGHADPRLAQMKMGMNNKIAESDESNNSWDGTIIYRAKGAPAPTGVPAFAPHTCTDSPETKPAPKPAPIPVAQADLKGKISDYDLKSVAGVMVTAGGKSAKTDSSGFYEIKGLEPKEYKVKFSAIGASEEKTVTLVEGENTYNLAIDVLTTAVKVQNKDYQVFFEETVDAGDPKKTAVVVRAFSYSKSGDQVVETEEDLSGVKITTHNDLINATGVAEQILLTAHIWYFFQSGKKTRHDNYWSLVVNYLKRTLKDYKDSAELQALRDAAKGTWELIQLGDSSVMYTEAMFSKGMSLPSDFLQNIFWDVVFDLYIDYYFGKDLDNKTSNLEQAQTYLMNANIQMETFHNTWNQFQSETTWDKAKVLRYMSIAGLKNLRDSLKPLALPASFEGKSGFWLYKGKVKKIDITEKTNYQNNDAGTYLLEIEVPAGALAVKASTSVSPLIDKYKTEDGTYDRWFAATQASGLDFLEGHVRWELSQLVKWKWQGSIDDPSNYASWKTGQKWAGYVFPSITATKGTLSLDLDRKWGSEVVRQLTAHDRDIHVDILIDETKSLTTAKYPITQMIDQIESLGRENTIVIQKK